MRLHLFEFEDFKWFPDIIRTGGTDYLRYFLIKTELYKPCIPLIFHTLKSTGQKNIIDLCSGGGGYIEQVYEELSTLDSGELTITLTDKYPNIYTYELIKHRTNGRIDYKAFSVDVFKMPSDLQGLRVMFSAIHHFKPAQVAAILQDAVNTNKSICIFDGGEKGLIPILGLLLMHPIAFLLFTPFFKPVKLSRFIFTYLIPLIPLYTIWDGVVSIIRMYTPDDFRKIINTLEKNNYTWECGKTTNRFGIKASYLIGYPEPRKQGEA